MVIKLTNTIISAAKRGIKAIYPEIRDGYTEDKPSGKYLDEAIFEQKPRFLSAF